MPSSGHWTIEGREGSNTFWEQKLPGYLGEKRIILLLQRLAARHLAEHEIVACSLRPKDSGYRPLLEPQIDGGRQGSISVGQNPFYVASKIQNRVE